MYAGMPPMVNRAPRRKPSGLVTAKFIRARAIALLLRARKVCYVQPWAHKVGLDYQMAYREPGAALIVPAVICNDQNAGHTPISTSLFNPSGVAISTVTGRLYVGTLAREREG